MYRTIDSEIWIDHKVRALDINSKLIWVYLITNTHTHLSGVYYLPLPFISHELGISDKGVRGGFKALEDANMLKYDTEFEIVWVIKMLRRQKGITVKNKNAWKSLLTQLDIFKDSFIIPLFLNEYNDLEIPFKAPSKPLLRGQVIVKDIVPVKAPSTYSEKFERFWNVYPKKVGKGEAWKIWKRMRFDTEIDRFIKAVEKQSRSDDWKKNNGQYIPNPSTWLNQGRWDDELSYGKYSSSITSPNPKGDGRLSLEQEIAMNKHNVD